jgi:hypothetical protein
MKRFIVLIAMLLPMVSYAQIPAMEQLGYEAEKQTDVEYFSAGSVMLGMAQTFANKEQRATFKMLDNIDMITCNNPSYAKTLEQRALAIAQSVGAGHLVTSHDERGRNDVYILKQGNIVKEVIIITHSKSGGLGVVAMSGTIPYERLGELSKLSPPSKN